MKVGKHIWILLLLCATGCSWMDPDIPDYNSLSKAVLPEMSIELAEPIYSRQANLTIRIKSPDNKKPSKMVLCYSLHADFPDATTDTIDLLPRFVNGVLDVELNNLRPSTLYHCRMYAETQDESGYSDSFRFKTSTVGTEQIWTKVCDFPKEFDWYSNAVTIGEDVYIRGYKLENHLDIGDFAIWKYTPSAGSWSKISDFPGGRRSEPVMFNIGTKLYVGMGGIKQEDNRYRYQTDLWEYDTSTGKWKRIADYPKTDYHIMTAFGSGGKGYLATSSAGWDGFSTTVFMYDPAYDTWTKRADFSGMKVNNTLTLTVGGRAFILGGSFSYGTEPLFSNYLWEYDINTDTWFRRADFPGTGRWCPMGFVIGENFYAGYGEENRPDDLMELVNDFWFYSVETDSWEPRSSFSVWFPGFFSLSFGMKDAGYIGAKLMGLWKYSPEKDK